jgi:hypothetical protein
MAGGKSIGIKNSLSYLKTSSKAKAKTNDKSTEST